MSIVDEYFHSQLEDIFFLELKEDNKLGLAKDFPLPIVRKDFAESIENQSFEEEIQVKYFIRGILFLLAMDPNFIYREEYEKLLKKWLPDYHQSIFFLGMGQLFDPLDALFYFRANKILGDSSLNNEFFYYYCLREIDEDLEDLLLISLKGFNDLIKRDPHFPLSYYGLAELEWSYQNYIKADLYYKEALEKIDFAELPLDLIKSLEEDILEKRRLIHQDRRLQEARQFMEEGQLEKSLDILKNLDRNSAIVNYLIGRNYLMAGQLEEAEEYFIFAYDYGYRQASYYLDHSFVEFHLGDPMEALKIVDEGLKNYHDEENLLYNRAMIYLAMDEKEAAIADLRTIVSYDDSNENIFNQAMIILEELT